MMPPARGVRPSGARRRHAPPTGRLVLLALLVGVSCALPPRPQPGPVVYREPQVDILDYDISVDLDHQAGFVSGHVEITYQGLPGASGTELVLDAVELDIQGAWDTDGEPLDVDVQDETLTVHLSRPALPDLEQSVTLQWTCFPRRGLHFIAPSGRAPDRGWHVWTQGQAEDTRHWMPVWDIPNEMATHSLTLTLDAGLMSLGAGRRTDTLVDERSGRRTEAWRMDVPHTSYLITFVAGDFARGELGGARVPLPVLADEADLITAVENSRHTADILTFMEELTGIAYPYTKYAQSFVHDYTAGGMENVSATTLYYEGIHDASDEPQIDITGLLAHEIAHQWFGDLMCGRGWKEIWLNEGFANYCEALYMGHLEGPDRQAVILRDWQREYVAAERADSRPIVWSGYRHPDDLFDAHIYQGGAARLHLLRDEIGDDAFLAGLQLYVQRHQQRSVTTADLRMAMEEASGVELTWFFDQWLHGRGYPLIRAQLDGEVLQLQQHAAREGWPAVFKVTLDVRWSRGGREHQARHTLDSARSTLTLNGQGDIDWVHVDSGGVLPGQMFLDQPAAAWALQLRQANAAFSRLLAAEWLSGSGWVRESAFAAPDADAREVLREAARGDSFPDVRVAALNALTDLGTDEQSTMLFIDLATDDDPRVRAAALEALGYEPGDDGLLVLRQALEDPNGDVAYTAMEGLIAAQTPGAWRQLRRLFGSSGPRKLRLQRDLVSLSPFTGHPDVLPFLVGVARRHPERWVRAEAVRVLGGWRGPHADEVFWELCRALRDESYSVRASAAIALGQRRDQRARLQLQAQRDLEGHAPVLHAIDTALLELDG